MKSKKSPRKCIEILKEVLGDNNMSHAGIFESHKRFSDDGDTVEGELQELKEKFSE